MKVNYKKVMISFFIVFNFLTMMRVHLPLEYVFFKELYRPIDKYLSFFSIYQDWMMFSPNPTRLNGYMTADVVFQDGTKNTYEFPRSSQLSGLDKYIYGERYRKLITEAIRKDDHQYLWRDTAKFVLRKMKNESYKKIPIKVQLIRHWYITPEMNEKFIPHLSKSAVYESRKFFTYEVL